MRGGGRLAAVLALALVATAAPAATLHVERTPFQTLRVERDDASGVVRLCNRDCSFVQGSFDPARPAMLADAYMRADLALGLAHLHHVPRDVLLVGMGTGAMARYLLAKLPHARIDVVEIDPAVPPLARKYFGFPADARLRVHVADGRRFIERTTRRYDLVLQDASFGPEPPPHLATIECVKSLARRLRPGGVAVANLAAAPLNPQLGAMVATYRAVFGPVTVHATRSAANVALVAVTAGKRASTAEVATRAEALRAAGVLAFPLDPDELAPLPWTWPEVAVLRDPPRR